MKKGMSVIFVCALLATLTTAAHGQFMFSVRPELLGLNGAAFGYQFPGGNVAIFGGMDYIHADATISQSSSSSFSFGGAPPQTQSSSSETEASLSLYNIFVGAKFFVMKSGSAKGYLIAEVSKPIVSISAETNGKENPNVKEISDNLSIWGIKAGVGGEYFFSEEFSLGGEFGLRLLFTSTNTENSSSSTGGAPPYNYTSSYTSKTDVKVNLGLTYTSLTLSYYFQ